MRLRPEDGSTLNAMMTSKFRFRINGKNQELSTDPQRTLLEVIREDLGLTGTKYGCGEGQCRACTVIMDGVAVRSCLTEITEAQNKNIETIEGLSNGSELHPVQEAFLSENAMQCGFCVPGMIMTTVALLRRQPNPSRAEAIDALNGNLCRCCGYLNILKAVERVSQKTKEKE
jgi:carbon-monoxide dehydrogenase small subunit